MNLKEFVNKYIGKKVDYDGAYGYQCVDLFRQYCQDVLGIPHTGAVEGAQDLYLNYEEMPEEKKYFEKINPEEKLIPGDVVIWGGSRTNKYGHVAIYLGVGGGDDLFVLEQDGFKQDGVKISTRTKIRYLGALRRRGNV